MKKHIPNLLTLANLLSGCIGISFVAQGHIAWACYFVWIAAFFDFFDGFAARALKVASPIGKELDSLADMVTFGVLPAYMVFQWLLQLDHQTWLPYVAFLLAAFSALRLANFNIDERQSSGFIGVPTPAMALFFTGLPLLSIEHSLFSDVLNNEWILIGLVLAFSYLMVAEIAMIALKFKQFGWRENWEKYLVLIAAVVFILFFQISALPFIILFYIILSLIYSGLNPQKNR